MAKRRQDTQITRDDHDAAEEHNNSIFRASQESYSIQNNQRVAERRTKYKAKRAASKTYSDAPHVPNIMLMTPEQRKEYIRTTENPYGWPLEYYHIYMRERANTNPSGFDGLACIDGVKLFQPHGDQVAGKIRIKQTTNRNCIKSRSKDYIDLDNIIFGPKVLEMLASKGIMYANDFATFFRYKSSVNEQYQTEMNEIKRFEPVTDYSNYANINWDEHRELSNEYQNRINDLDSRFTAAIEPEYHEIIKNQPNKYQVIVEIIRICLGEYAQYVAIAGGFSYSKWVYETYGESFNFGDIDLFIHSCDEETANKIIPLIKNITGHGIYKNDNVFSSIINCCEVDEEENEYLISITDGCKSIQIIKRLYTCPGQVIPGFDVDCCCILTILEGKTFATERACYALKHGYNVLNFDRMSPSFEFREVKYNLRGMGIWISFMEYFIANAVFDVDKLDKKKMSSVIISSLIKSGLNIGIYDRKKRPEMEISDYASKQKGMTRYNGEYEEFKKLNPGEQIINTFHRIVLEDPIAWYPLRSPDILDRIFINDKSLNSVEIKEELNPHLFSGMNVIKVFKSDKSTNRAMQTSRAIIRFLDRMVPNSFISGGITMAALSGVSGYDIKFYNENIDTLDKQRMINYYLKKFRILYAVKNTFAKFLPEFDDSEIDKLGTIQFRIPGDVNSEYNEIINIEEISEEENQRRFVEDEHIDQASTSLYGIQNKYRNVWNPITGEMEYKYFKSHSFIPSKLLSDYITVGLNNEDIVRSVIGIKEDEFEQFKVDVVSDINSVLFKRDGAYWNWIVESRYAADKMFYDTLNDQQKEQVIQTTKLAIELRDRKMYDEFSKTLFIVDQEFIDFETVLPKFTDEIIFNRVKRLFLKSLVYSMNRGALAFKAMYYGLSEIPSNINITFAHFLDANFMKENPFYHQGKYFGTEYDINLIKLGMSHRDVENGRVKVLDSPAWQQFIPNDEVFVNIQP